MKTFEGYIHGINLGGWLSQCVHTKEHYDSFIHEEDIETIKKWGMDHFRVPVDYELVERGAGDYKEDGFQYLQNAIDWAGKNGLNMVLDLHKTAGFSFDEGEAETGFFENEEYQERFYLLWEEFAKRFGKYSDRLSFELLNEVTKKEYCDTWNRISRTCVERIRKYAPDIKILIGGYYNNAIESLKDIAPPYDENIVYNFHCYEPLIFTHQGAHWIPTMDNDFRMPFDVTYKEYKQNTRNNLEGFTINFDSYNENDKIGIEFFRDLVKEAVRVADERNVALYCGEFGVINLAEPEDSKKWYEMICKCFDEYGIGRAAWSFRQMDFGIEDEHMASVRDDILKMI